MGPFGHAKERLANARADGGQGEKSIAGGSGEIRNRRLRIGSLGVRGRGTVSCEHVGTLVSVMYDASTRAVVVDSMR